MILLGYLVGVYAYDGAEAVIRMELRAYADWLIVVAPETRVGAIVFNLHGEPDVYVKLRTQNIGAKLVGCHCLNLRYMYGYRALYWTLDKMNVS